MGFEPFTIPRRTIDSGKAGGEGRTREERVNVLAQLLHQRGLTSSMTDARRLAEGMVDVERKVFDQAKGASSQHNATEPGQRAVANAPPAPPSVSSSAWPERFTKFVAQVAVIHEESDAQPVPRPAAEPQATASPKTMTYGREEQRRVAEVPHTSGGKQLFFADAPPITAARGYTGPRPQTIEYMTQKTDSPRRGASLQPSSAPSATTQPAIPQTPPPSPVPVRESVTIAVEDAGVKVIVTKETPDATVVQERMVIEDATPSVVPSSPAPPNPQPSVAPSSPQEAERPPEKPASKPASPDAVDLFEFFKKKE